MLQIHTCNPGCNHDPALKRQRFSQDLTIDLHCHILTPEVEALVEPLPARQAERRAHGLALGGGSVRHNADVMSPVANRRMTTLRERIDDMDAMGVDIQVLSPSPTQYYYWAEPELAERICRLQNEHIAEQCQRHPDRLLGLGAVALQHPELAARQAEDCVRRLGLKGVEISSTANQKDLSAPEFEPFWRAVDRLGCVVFLHPLGTSLGERVNTHYLANLIGQPLETTIALSKLIFDGVLDRHPRLKLLAAHGGGYLPAYPGRNDHGAAVRPEAGVQRDRPSEYLRRIWFDTAVHSPQALRHLIDTVGVDRLVVGTDYPFDMGHYDAHGLLAQVPGLTPFERSRILGLNAAALLDLPAGRSR